MTEPVSEPARVIGVAGVAFTLFNCVVGVGIFALPGLVAGVLEPAAILAAALMIGWLVVGAAYAVRRAVRRPKPAP